ncbi:MAG: C45 family autoproteolytic acyltransferase/hydrolase [Promethearchaeota archaeon]
MSHSQKKNQKKQIFLQNQEFILTQVLGSPFEIGLQIGKILRQNKRWIRTIPPSDPAGEDLIRIRDYLSSFDSALFDEIGGLATSLGWSFADALIYFSGWDVMRRMNEFRQGNLQSCTHFFLPPSTVSSFEPYLCRNFDFFYNFTDRMFLEIPGNSARISTVGMSHQIIGRADGLNRKGVICSNSITTSAGLAKKGFSHPILTRLVLDCSHDAEEGIELLRSLPQSTSVNYLVADISGAAYIFEQSKRNFAIREIEPGHGIIATNHIVTKNIQDRWSRPSDTSGERFDYIISLLHKNQGSWSLELMKKALQTHQPQICDHAIHKGVATLCSIIYNPKSFKVWISPGQPCINEYSEISPFPLKNQTLSGVYECAGHCGYRIIEKYRDLLYNTTYP